MDRKTLETLKRLRKILLNIDFYGYANHHLDLSYKQHKHLGNMLGKLSTTLFETCILDYEVRKKMHKEIRELLKEGN